LLSVPINRGALRTFRLSKRQRVKKSIKTAVATVQGQTTYANYRGRIYVRSRAMAVINRVLAMRRSPYTDAQILCVLSDILSSKAVNTQVFSILQNLEMNGLFNASVAIVERYR